MERERKSREEFVVKKLRGGNLVGKREGNCTPSPTWKFGLIQPDGTLVQDFNFPPNTTLSARKLVANLWEVQPHLTLKMNRNVTKDNHLKIEEFKASKQLSESPDRSPEQATSSSGLKKHVSALTTQHNQRLKRVGHVQRPVSTASYCSSMEMAPYRPPRSPNSSFDTKGKLGTPSCSFQTSTELLKVLNRIWKLEEKHALNISLIKTLKRELDQSNARIKELLQEKKRDQQEIAELMKEITEDKVSRKYKEQHQMKDAFESIGHELEDERKLRKHSENLHYKLSRELSEVKSLFSNALNELKQERKARILLEDLCDEFAKGIRDYEQDIRLLRQKSHESQIGKDGNDRLILHISEAWLDERMQMKLADARDVTEKPSVLDKLRFEIETFLQAKQSGNLEINDFQSSEKPRENNLCRRSSESQLNKGVSLKQGNDSTKQPAEIIADSRLKTTEKSKPIKKKAVSREVEGSDPSRLQVQSEEQVMHDQDYVNEEPAKENLDEKTNNLPNDLIRNPSLASEGKKLRNGNNYMESSFDPSTFTGPSSPVLKWTSEVKAADPNTSESFSRWPRSFKPNTLQAKLLEARLEGQRPCAQVSKDLSQAD
ncbi:unnamed protein product [Fraxinus pennsylvanica]|uniref:Uncharacterized protein n=1 Tax=Fraxinus pennsylvanica TaxID=56036 RepID=A0AAD2DU90_9LAMI|nr:unnamed protein product [Fraxinus pennsylvanica]